MRIASVASAFPEYYYKQEILTEALKNDWRHRLSNPDILDRLDESMQVEGRYLVEPIDFYEGLTTWGQANNAWIAHALELGEESLCKALAQGRSRARRISAQFLSLPLPALPLPLWTRGWSTAWASPPTSSVFRFSVWVASRAPLGFRALRIM